MTTPETFGKYHLLERIAVGGMAEVYRARSYGAAGFEKILVIKRVLDHLGKDPEFVRLFVDEAHIAVLLEHANIVKVWELGEVEGSYFMAMEYVHGLDLSRLVTRARNLGPFPVSIAVFIVAEVLKALEFAHARTDEDGNPLHIVHCDISPQNVLISFSGEVKLTDFGISRAAFQASSQHEVIRGKYAYMSPEQVDGKVLDGRSDLFSLGIVLYEALTGRRLFKGKSREETLGRVRRAEVPSPRSYRAEISPDLEAFLLKALARRPEQRFQSASEMLRGLHEIAVREGLRATNSDVSVFLNDVIVSAQSAARGEKPEPAAVQHLGSPPVPVVVLAVEATPPPRSLSAPRSTLAALTQVWAAVIGQAEGEIWERSEGAMLAVWRAEDLEGALRKAVQVARELELTTVEAAYRLSAGVAPGFARINPATGRPSDGWELAGPFYLARWMMNLSAHRGRVLVTEVGKKHVPIKAQLLGRIPIQGNRTINLYEVA